MKIKLHNTLTRQKEEFTPLTDGVATVYTCGPTVYDRVHIGNIRSFIFADTLRRTLSASGLEVKQVMNLTDVDDKTIKKSRSAQTPSEPITALLEVTRKYEDHFRTDAATVGVDLDAVTVIRATEHIEQMQRIIRALHENGIAYIANDGVYFSIDGYRKAGYKYGVFRQLEDATGQERIANDEYDKEAAHDFALWKLAKPDEPSWEFELDSQDLKGRPGWHIECSAMSTEYLGQPFDIHTGGVDLQFPHHENEIAQSTGTNGKEFAKIFMHNEHLLVDGRKMAKSAGNFYTLEQLEEKGFEPLILRLLMLQSHYRTQTNFTWESLQAAGQFLRRLRSFADLKHQTVEGAETEVDFEQARQKILEALADDLNTPQALAELSKLLDAVEDKPLSSDQVDGFQRFLGFLDDVFGLELADRPDLDDAAKDLIGEREQARQGKDFAASDKLRDQLYEAGVAVDDTPWGAVWHRVDQNPSQSSPS